MKLDNVDVAKLQLTDLPKFNKCPCELCDDGCFERANHQHYPACRRRLILPRAARCPLSHYKQTFLPATRTSDGPADHRRHPCPPAPDNEIPISFKNIPMSGVSSQRDHYQPPPPGTKKQESAAPAKHTDNLLVSCAVPMKAQSNYQLEYVEKPVIPVSISPLKIPTKDSQISITDPTAQMTSQTTTQSHFKSWPLASTSSYAEMPAVVGYVLFPGSNRNFDTTAGSTFVPFPKASQAKPIARPEHNGNLKTSGVMDLRTNYQQDYVPYDASTVKRSIPNGTKDGLNERKVSIRFPMNGISQTSSDFRPYPKHRPPPAADTEPFLSQITIGDSLTPIITKSQYRVDYPGHDINQHPRQPAAAALKDRQQSYITPSHKMDTMTVTQRDFQPNDVTTLPRIRVVSTKPSLSVSDQQGPMESVSMSRHHYQPHKPAISKRRYGELIPTLYIPPINKFQTLTTSGEAYKGRLGQRARACVPEVRMINRMGEHDHNTSYRVDYHPHGLSLCAAKAYAIAQNKQATTTIISA